jgi:hypothetical protein
VEDWLGALDGVAYLVSPGGEVVAVGRKAWAAGTPGATIPTPEAVIGRNLFEMIADPEARLAFQAIHRRVATLATSALTYEYRCDAPDLERLMKMSVSALASPEGDVLGVLYQSTLLSAKARVPLAFLGARDEQHGSNLPFVTVCQFCADVTMAAWRGEWVKPVDYYRRGGHDAVRLSQGVCPTCERTRLAPLLGP